METEDDSLSFEIINESINYSENDSLGDHARDINLGAIFGLAEPQRQEPESVTTLDFVPLNVLRQSEGATEGEVGTVSSSLANILSFPDQNSETRLHSQPNQAADETRTVWQLPTAAAASATNTAVSNSSFASIISLHQQSSETSRLHSQPTEVADETRTVWYVGLPTTTTRTVPSDSSGEAWSVFSDSHPQTQEQQNPLYQSQNKGCIQDELLDTNMLVSLPDTATDYAGLEQEASRSSFPLPDTATDYAGLEQEASRSSFPLPDAYTITGDEAHRLFLMSKYPAMWTGLQAAMQELHASCDMQHAPEYINVACTLTQQTKNGLRLVKSWSEDIRRAVTHILENIHVEILAISSEEFREAETRLNELADNLKICIIMEEPTQTLCVLFDDKAEYTAVDKIREVIAETRQMLARNQNEICECMDISLGDLLLFQETSSFVDITTRFPQFQFRYILGDQPCLEMIGLQKEIDEMKVKVLKVSSAIARRRQEWKCSLISMLMKVSQVQDLIRSGCKAIDPTAVVSFAEDHFSVSTFNPRLLDKVFLMVNKTVRKWEMQLGSENRHVLNMPIWLDTLDQIKKKNRDRVLFYCDQIVFIVVGVQSSFDEDVQKMKQIFEKHKTINGKFSVTEPIQLFLEPQLQQHLRHEQQQDGNVIVDVKFDQYLSAFVMCGNSAGVELATKLLTNLSKETTSKIETFSLPAFRKFLQTPEWDRKMREVENLYSCIILDDAKQFDNLMCQEVHHVCENSSLTLSLGSSCHEASSYVSLGLEVFAAVVPKIQINLKLKSDITQEQCHVIVNSTHSGLSLNNGIVSKAILAAAGQGVQTECQRRYPNGIKALEIAVTGAGRLYPKNIFHCSLPIEKDPAAIKQLLMKVVIKCLQTAEEMRHTSIAFPAIGTGTLKYPPLTVAEAMFEAVMKYENLYPNATLSDVRFVLRSVDRPVVQAFCSEKDRYEKFIKAQQQFAGGKFFEKSIQKEQVLFMANCPENIEQAVNQMMELYNGMIKTATFNVARLQNWSEQDMEKLMAACRNELVDVIYDFGLSEIKFVGLSPNVDTVVTTMTGLSGNVKAKRVQ